MSRKGNRFKCWYCGQAEKCTKDHFYPKSNGGRTTVYACRICQATKGGMMPDKFIEYMDGHEMIREEKKERIRTAVESLMAHTKDEYLRIKRRIHNEEFEQLKV